MMSNLMFNVTAPDGNLLCPVCGLPGYAGSPAYSEQGGEIGSALCPCCLWEPGFDDNPLASGQAKSTILETVIAYRTGWMATKQWQGNRRGMPKDFDADRQLADLAQIVPHLF